MYVFFLFFKMFFKTEKVVRVWKKWSEGGKNGVKWGKKLAPESAFIHYCQHLLNRWANLNQTWQECALGGRL